MKIFLALLIFTALILLVPVRFSFCSEPQLKAEIKYLLFKKQLFPVVEKEKKPKKQKREKKNPERKKKAPALDKKRLIKLIPAAYRKLMPPIKRLLKRTTIAGLSLKIAVAGDDAAETALKFGRTNAAVVNGVSVIDKVFSLRVKEIDIIPNFESCESSFKGSGELRVIPLAVLAAVASLGINALPLVFAVLKGEKKTRSESPSERKEENNGKEESAGRCA